MAEQTEQPKRIGRYDIERVLGEGAMGVVYEGHDTRLHRKVAIKTILKSALDSEAAKLLRQATREGKGEAAGQAAKRMGDLLQKGVPGVSRDYGEALRYYDIARLNGVEVPYQKGR